MERRSPTGIARERAMTRVMPTEAPHRQAQKERRSPTGIARERETSPDDAASCQPEAEGRELRPASPGEPQKERPAEGAPVSDRHRAGARNQPR